MTSHALFAPPSPPTAVAAPPRRLTAAVATVCALGAALTLLAVIGIVNLVAGGPGAGHGKAGTAYSAPSHAFELTLPHGWRALSGAQLERVPGNPAAVIRRSDGRGLVIVRRIPAVHGDLRAVASHLTVQLRRRVAGFRLVSARLGHVRAGGAFLYTFVRGGGSAVQSLAITTVRGATYRVDSIVPAREAGAARDAGAIVRSFGG